MKSSNAGFMGTADAENQFSSPIALSVLIFQDQSPAIGEPKDTTHPPHLPNGRGRIRNVSRFDEVVLREHVELLRLHFPPLRELFGLC